MAGWGKYTDIRNIGYKGSDAVVYDDLQVGISNVRIPVSNAPTERLYDFGIGGGVTFPIYGFAVNEYFYFDIQTKHAMKLNTEIFNHFHWMTPTNGTGSKFKFQLDVISAPVFENWSVPAGSPFTIEVDIASNTSNTHEISAMADIPAVNSTVSTTYRCRFTRIAASTNEYSGEVYINYNDSHVALNQLGSLNVTHK